MIANLYKLLKGVSREIEEEYKENQKLLQEYYNKVKVNFEKDGKCFLVNKDETYRSMIETGNYTTVCFAVSMFAPFTIQYIGNNRTLNIYLGYNYEDGIRIAEEMKTDKTVIFKSFTDNTRLKIIELLKQNKKLYAGEIGEMLKMPMSSLAHHLDILCTSNIIERRNEGKRTYYRLKLEAVFTAIQLLRKIAS